MIGQAIGILVASTAYTIMRYHVLGPEPLEVPAYLLNKAVSLASVVYLLLAAVAHRQCRPESLRSWGTAALHAGFVHILLSVTLMSESYYPVFYDGGRLSFRGEFAVAFGTLAAYGFWLIRRNRTHERLKRILQTASAVLIATHLVFLGSRGWLRPEAWHGNLPPVSLLALVTVLAGGILFLTTPVSKSETSP